MGRSRLAAAWSGGSAGREVRELGEETREGPGGMRVLPSGDGKGGSGGKLRSALCQQSVYSRLVLERVYGNLDSSLLLLFDTVLRSQNPMF